MQRTIVLIYKGQEIVSQPFTFRHACIIDDARYNEEGFATGAGKALKKMFEGTVITDKVIDDLEVEGGVKTLKDATGKILDWFLGIDKETKNSSSPQPEKAEVGD